MGGWILYKSVSYCLLYRNEKRTSVYETGIKKLFFVKLTPF